MLCDWKEAVWMRARLGVCVCVSVCERDKAGAPVWSADHQHHHVADIPGQPGTAQRSFFIEMTQNNWLICQPQTEFLLGAQTFEPKHTQIARVCLYQHQCIFVFRGFMFYETQLSLCVVFTITGC